jgi:hypothetical protein
MTEQSLTDLMDEHRVVPVPASELDALRRDAGRYRWIREQQDLPNAAIWLMPVDFEFTELVTPTVFDSAIDTVMKSNRKRAENRF